MAQGRRGFSGGHLNILDRYHIVAKLSKALDNVRAAEAKELKRKGYEEVLKHTKYGFLKNPENLTDMQKVRLKDVLRYDLKSVRAMRSKLEPIKKFVGTLRNHEDLLMNWFKAKKEYSCGAVEGLNRKVNLITRKSYGFRSLKVLTTAPYHAMGQLPEPHLTQCF